MSSSRVKPGDVLGDKYRVERILGAGGMGVVVAARHIELNQRVALKFMLKEAMTDPSHAERFLREARAAVQLKSIHTAKVVDVGKLSNGDPYMVMEYLEGCDLDEELKKKGPMMPHVAVEYILQASEALAEAHGLSMVHRDVKLKNLFLTSTIDGRPLVKVLDFGLAKTLGQHNDVSLTAVNSVFGSPQYMSPEQMRSAKDVDFRSDIWSLGVCLYELLTGRVPFDAAGVAEICAMVLKDPVPRPTQFARVPPDLENVVMRCLEKDPARRYQSIAEVAFALQAYASDEGSARRILTVMQQSQAVAQKIEHNTFVTPDAPGVDGTGKTLNAWDSGPRSRTMRELTRNQLAGVIGLCVAMAGAGLGLGIYVVKMRGDALRPVSTTADPTPAVSAEPPPESNITLPPPSATTSANPVATNAPEPDDSTKKSPPPRPAPVGAAPPHPPTVRPPPAASQKKPSTPGRGAEYM
ncbi:MAG: protein kinase [Labilithrix sp.]